MIGTLETGIVLVSVAVVLAYKLGYRRHEAKVRSSMNALEWYVENCLVRQGFTRLNNIGEYRIVSVDGGKHWAAIDRFGVIVGDAKIVCPGLLQDLEAKGKLVKPVRGKGPVILDYEPDLEILRGVGFMVSKGE